MAESVLAEASAAAGVGGTRLSGRDRFATSAAVAERSLSEGLGLRTPRVATGWAFPDALAAGPAAAADGSVLLLVDGRDLAGSPSTASLLDRAAGTARYAVLVGGTSAVGPGPAQEVDRRLHR